MNTEISALKTLLDEDCKTQQAIEDLCARVLGQGWIDGDSNGVPGPEACVAEVVRRLEAAQFDLAATEARLGVVPTAALESVQKQNAAMREKLVWLLSKVDVDALNAMHKGSYSAIRDLIESADAGRDYISKASVKPLVDALQNMTFFCEDYLRSNTHSGVSRLVSDSKKALAHAKEAGLAEAKP